MFSWHGQSSTVFFTLEAYGVGRVSGLLWETVGIHVDHLDLA